ncbi:MAG TPA: cytochrome C oxidase subunit IV family protein [Polyangia bacterium]|nr:cytochrome C oxidase subunit IV family protein [Polyangia bacterium]
MSTSKRASVIPYLLAYVALLVLAVVSLAFARAVHRPRWDLVVSLTIAVLQSSIVLWVFMHLAEAGFPIRFGLGVGVSLLLTLLLLTVADVATREVQPMAASPGPSFGFYQR